MNRESIIYKKGIYVLQQYLKTIYLIKFLEYLFFLNKTKYK